MTVTELETTVIDLLYSKYVPNTITHYTKHYYVSFKDMRTGKTRRIHCANKDRLVTVYNKYKSKNYTCDFDVWLYVDIYKRIPNTWYVESKPYKRELMRITDVFKKCKGVCKH